MKSEFIALELVGQEAEWLRNLLTNMPFHIPDNNMDLLAFLDPEKKPQKTCKAL